MAALQTLSQLSRRWLVLQQITRPHGGVSTFMPPGNQLIALNA